MSLLEALLTEGYRDPRDIYIALRADGQRGSGTIDDPYDGGTWLGPAMQGTVTRPLGPNGERILFVLAPQQQAFFGTGPWADNRVTTATMVGVDGSDATKSYFNKQWSITPESDPQVPNYHSLFKISPASEPPDAPAANSFIYAIRPELTTNPPSASWTFPASLSWEVLVTTPAPHGLVKYDVVLVSDYAPFNGHYHVTETPSPTTFKIRVPPIPWPATSPSITWQKVIHRFDEVLAAASVNSVIHLGPGTFETRGLGPFVDLNTGVAVYVGYTVKAGWRVLGSGVGATTLKLVFPSDVTSQNSIFGNYVSVPADFAEFADFTADCNAAGHAVPPGMLTAPLTCGAFELNGSFIRIHRVRVISFCVQARAENFPLFVRAGTFSVIEECVMERPGLNNTHETTLLSSVGDGYGSAVSPIVRRNYVDMHFVRDDGGAVSRLSSEYVAVTSLSTPASGQFVLETKRPHRRLPGQNVLILNVANISDPTLLHPLVGAFRIKSVATVPPWTEPTQMTCEFLNPSFPEYDASKAYIGIDFHGPDALGGSGCAIEGNAVYDCFRALYADTGSTRDVVVRDNYYSNIGSGVNVDFNPASAGVESPRLARTGVNLVSLTHSGGDGRTANANSGTPPSSPGTPGTGTPHGLVEGEAVAISGALMPDDSPPPVGTYNGNYPIHVVDAYNFTYLMENSPVLNAKVPTDSAPIRVGIYSLKRDANNPKIAILASPTPHFLKVGDVVEIIEARRNGVTIPTGQSFNDTVSVLAVVSDKIFSYQMNSDPGGNADPSTEDEPIKFRSRYQIHRLICEQNVFDLYAMDANSPFPPSGMGTIGYQAGDLFMFPQMVARENFIQHIDATPGVLLPSGFPNFPSGSPGFRLVSFEQALIERNLIRVSAPHPINYVVSKRVTGFGNQTPSGQRLPIERDVQGGGLFGPFQDQDSVEVRLQDALLASFL